MPSGAVFSEVAPQASVAANDAVQTGDGGSDVSKDAVHLRRFGQDGDNPWKSRMTDDDCPRPRGSALEEWRGPAHHPYCHHRPPARPPPTAWTACGLVVRPGRLQTICPVLTASARDLPYPSIVTTAVDPIPSTTTTATITTLTHSATIHQLGQTSWHSLRRPAPAASQQFSSHISAYPRPQQPAGHLRFHMHMPIHMNYICE